MQTIAAFFATKFSTALNKIGICDAIKFLKAQIFSTSDGKQFWCYEKCLPFGCKFMKFSNNFDHAMMEMTAAQNGVPMQYVELLAAFSHWTYQITNGYLMVVDLQGIITSDSDGKQVIVLTDPAIHCTDMTRFGLGRTNFGEAGMKGFFRGHKCNAICQKMGLVVPEEYQN